MPIIVARGITRRFPHAPGEGALRGADLQVDAGEFVCIQGASGSGKSTLLNIIGLLDEPSSGDYQLGGRSTKGLSRSQVTQSRCDHFSYIFQSFHLLERRVAIDSVELGLLYRGVDARARRQRALAALDKVGLSHLAYSQVNLMSGGERQRVAVARALATGAPILLADEPTGNLDSANGQAVMDSLQLLRSEGVTVVMVTHDTSLSARADRTVSMADGVVTGVTTHRHPSLQTEVVVVPPTPPGRASRLRAIDLWRDALRSVRARKGRSAALAGAVALAVGLGVATWGIGLSAGAQVSDTFDATLNKDVTVIGYPATATSEADGLNTVAARLGQIAGVEHAGIMEDFGGHEVRAFEHRPAYTTRLFSIYGEAIAGARATVEWADGHLGELREGEVLLGRQLFADMELGPLDSRPVISLDGRDVCVVGVITDTPREPELLVGIVRGGAVSPASDDVPSRRIGFLVVQPGAAQQVAKQAPLVLDPYEPQSVEVYAPIDPTKLRGQIESSLRTTLLVVAAVALIAAVGSLTNAMAIAVGQRSHEIGLRRALGARPSHISLLISLEALIIGLIGGATGLSAGLAAVLSITIAQRWTPVFDLALAPAALAAGMAVGALGGAFASWRATQIRPHQALRL